MPNNLDPIVTNKTIQYAKSIKNIGPRFISFFRSNYSKKWRDTSISFLKGLMMSESDLRKSEGEYIKVTEPNDKALQTNLKTEIDAFNQQIDADLSKYSQDLNAAKERKRRGLEGNFEIDYISLLAKHVKIISSKFDVKISQLNQRETSGDDKNFICAHNVILILHKFCNNMIKMIGSISYGSSRVDSEEAASSKSIFVEANMRQISFTADKPSEESSVAFTFTNNSSKIVRQYMLSNNITASASNTPNESVINDFIKYIDDKNSASKKDSFKNHLESIPAARYNVEFQDGSPAKVIFKFKAPPEVGEYCVIKSSVVSSSKYVVKASSTRFVNNIIKNAIGEAPLYKCKHKGKWYYYTPAQLVINGGKLTDSSGNKFRPKNGKPASLSGGKK